MITTLIFDVDDTLYDISTGFTKSRNGPIVHEFMVNVLKFADTETAKTIRDDYFKVYHSTAKGLTVAQQEGKFPENAPVFRANDLAEYWAEHLDYGLLGGPKTAVVEEFLELKKKFHFVAFSNGPRKYVKKVLQSLGMWETLFTESTLFAVDDVLPHCKPEAEAFRIIFDKVGVTDPSQCVMVEDSMKNLRMAKSMGMKTVLIYGTDDTDLAVTKPGDHPDETDPAVDVAMEKIEDFKSKIPGLWDTPPTFP